MVSWLIDSLKNADTTNHESINNVAMTI